jgi:ATP/maltotriose-dependent transcriptional regulator MalT
VGIDVPAAELRLAAAGARDGDDAALALRLARAAALAAGDLEDLRRWVDLAYEHHDDAGLDEGLAAIERWRADPVRTEDERTESAVVIGLVIAERAFWRRADAATAIDALEHAAVGTRRDEVRAVTARILAATGRFDEAIAIADPGSHSLDARTRAQSAAALGHALRRSGRPSEAVARIDEVLAQPDADDTVLVVSRRVLGAVRVLALLEAGAWAAAEAEADRTRAMSERLDDTPGLAVATLVLAAARCERGRTTEAGVIAHRALAMFQQLGQPAGVRWAWSVIGLAAGLGGDAASARTASERLIGLPTHPAALFSGFEARAQAWSATGHPDFVRERLATAARALAAAGDVSAALHCLHDLASVGAPDLARSLLDELQLDLDDAALLTIVHHVNVIAEADAPALVELAARYTEAGGDRWAAESTALAAGWAARGGDARAARRLAADAEVLAIRCPGLATPPLVVARVVDAGATPLTPRERDVATLAAHGLTSRAIAERLGLSARTVDNHLSNCFDKLHVRSRNELGAVLGIG